MIEVNKTTYEVDGCKEPCFEVSEEFFAYMTDEKNGYIKGIVRQ